MEDSNPLVGKGLPVNFGRHPQTGPVIYITDAITKPLTDITMIAGGEQTVNEDDDMFDSGSDNPSDARNDSGSPGVDAADDQRDNQKDAGLSADLPGTEPRVDIAEEAANIGIESDESEDDGGAEMFRNMHVREGLWKPSPD